MIAQEVVAAGIALKIALGQQGFAQARIGEQDVLIDHEARTARLVLPVDPGPMAQFGEIRVTGQPPFSARHVGLIARFERGDRFKQSDVDDLRRALVATGLVSTVEVKVAPVGAGQTVDLDVRLEPAPMRTIAGELGYGTGEGARAEASWQHRNFFTPEGACSGAGVGTQEQRRVSFRGIISATRPGAHAQVSASHVKRRLLRPSIAVSAGSSAKHFMAKNGRGAWWRIVLSTNATRSSRPPEAAAQFFIAALPVSLGYDGSESARPTGDSVLAGSPRILVAGQSLWLCQGAIRRVGYHPFSERVVAAGRVRVGTILGASRDLIAPSRRFYAGGGGSVRGYGYQQLGPRDANDDPIGGRSLAEFALEARIRVGGAFGIVPFFDGGTLSTEPLPNMKNWQFGAGIGARYYSSFGPIRIDVGTPLNRQKGDSRVAVTVSLGQAF